MLKIMSTKKRNTVTDEVLINSKNRLKATCYINLNYKL